MTLAEILIMVVKVGGTVNTYSDGGQDVVLTTEKLENFVQLLTEKINGNTCIHEQ